MHVAMLPWEIKNSHLAHNMLREALAHILAKSEAITESIVH